MSLDKEIAAYLARFGQPLREPPTCECGEEGHASKDGRFWECQTPGCDGYGQTLAARADR